MTLERQFSLSFESIPQACDLRHPLAQAGNLHDWKRANDKKDGKVKHYFQNGVLFYVEETKRSS